MIGSLTAIRTRLARTPLHTAWRFAQSLVGARANRGSVDEAQTFCLFLGHGRSGHSIIGALLDAHPDIVLADELDVLAYLKAGFSREQLLYLCLKTARDQARHGRLKPGRGGAAYSYLVPGQWQGRERRSEVIGASKAGSSVHRLNAEPELADRLADTMRGLDLRFIHVVRNPYDNLATMMVRRGRTFDDAFAEYFADWESLAQLRSRLGEQRLCTVAHEAILANPRDELGRLCRFLGVEPEADYLDACASILYPSPSQSRHSVSWTDVQRSLVAQRIAEFEPLRGYAFDEHDLGHQPGPDAPQGSPTDEPSGQSPHSG